MNLYPRNRHGDVRSMKIIQASAILIFHHLPMLCDWTQLPIAKDHVPQQRLSLNPSRTLHCTVPPQDFKIFRILGLCGGKGKNRRAETMFLIVLVFNNKKQFFRS